MDVRAIAPNDAVRFMLDSTDKSAYRMSLELGRSRNYLITAVGRDLHLSTLASVASVTGHKVAILDADTDDVVAVVDPPEPTKGSD